MSGCAVLQIRQITRIGGFDIEIEISIPGLENIRYSDEFVESITSSTNKNSRTMTKLAILKYHIEMGFELIRSTESKVADDEEISTYYLKMPGKTCSPPNGN